MNKSLLSSIAVIFSLAFIKADKSTISKTELGKARIFNLRYTSVPLNPFEFGSEFTVKGNRFFYTYGEVWKLPKQNKITKDTLLVGSFRLSSMDSIANMIRQIEDTVIYKWDQHVVSGGSMVNIEVSTENKKLRFDLTNISDPVADKVVAILNSYISDKLGKLY